ncbi:hypothetical protein F5878DRAFT_667202 [Lentinula raphanica]|uniref:Uncharacterized protein n=1 Tax=Lentinula raphanica TaxID=153919 RepID=A0AA38UAC0_9AGAR|nr:hypothetical protein F5878DRAFT_667202 [Lentinula raphanica]
MMRRRGTQGRDVLFVWYVSSLFFIISGSCKSQQMPSPSLGKALLALAMFL